MALGFLWWFIKWANMLCTLHEALWELQGCLAVCVAGRPSADLQAKCQSSRLLYSGFAQLQ